MYYSTSIRLINRRAKNYKKYHPLFYVPNFAKHLIPKIDKDAVFLGWGYKKSGLEAKEMPKYLLLEDGFIRSLGLGVEGYPAFSIVEDEKGMHYDAKKETTIENILNNYDFENDKKLLSLANDAIELIKKYKNHKNINIFVDKDVAKGMASSKFGIITPSVISYEAIYMKLPFVAIKTAKNQKEVARYLKKRYRVIDAKKLYTIRL